MRRLKLRRVIRLLVPLPPRLLLTAKEAPPLEVAGPPREVVVVAQEDKGVPLLEVMGTPREDAAEPPREVVAQEDKGILLLGVVAQLRGKGVPPREVVGTPREKAAEPPREVIVQGRETLLLAVACLERLVF